MHLPKLLDGNKEYGEFFLYLALQVMETCIKRNPGDDLANTRLSLIHLEPHLQHSWLTALIVILYKVCWNLKYYTVLVVTTHL